MSAQKQNLRIPGPTPLSEEVIKAVGRQMINHRAPIYEKMQTRIIENLRHFFQTENEIFLLTSSGMGGLEAAISNFFSPQDKIISFTCGDFGNRWAQVARNFWAEVVQVKFPLGESVDKDEVYRVFEQHTDAKGVLFTHNETATGVLNKIEEFAPLVKTHPAKPLFLIDAVSSLGAVDLPMDDLGIDVLVTASQKAWMAPPGISMIGVSQNAWERHKTAKMPRYYFDLSSFREFSRKNQTPATCAVATLYGLDRSLQLMRKEGRKNIFKRHLNIMKYTRKKIKELGLALFVSDEDASPTVTSIVMPEGIDGHKWLVLMREKYNTVLAGGMGEAKGKIIRIAHMGCVEKDDIDKAVEAIRLSLQDLQR